MFHSDKGTSHNMNHSTRAVATEMSSPLDLYTHTDLPKPNTALAGPRDRRMCDNTGFFFIPFLKIFNITDIPVETFFSCEINTTLAVI